MIQGLPVEAERCLAIGRVMVEGRDENPMDDGPEGAQDEPIQDGRNRPRQAAGLSDDPPHERDKADREQEEEHETGPQDSTLMGAPSLPQKGAAAPERFHRPDAFETEREDTEHDNQPDEAREDEGQERQRHEPRLGRKDAKAPKGQVEPTGELGAQSGFRSWLMVSLPTPLR